MSNEVVKKLVECVNVDAVVNIVIDDVIGKALDKIVSESSNKFDDAAKAMLWPLLEKEAKSLIKKAIEDFKAKA